LSIQTDHGLNQIIPGLIHTECTFMFRVCMYTVAFESKKFGADKIFECFLKMFMAEFT